MMMKSASTSTAFLAAAMLSASAAQAQPASAWPYTARQAPPQSPNTDFLQPQTRVTSWEPLRFAIALQGQAQWLRDDAAKRLAGTHAPTSAGVTAQAELLRPTPNVGLRLDLGWTTSSASNGQDVGRVQHLETDVVELGLSARYALFPWLLPYARVGGGVGWDKVTVGTGTASLHDHQRFGEGVAGGGIAVRSPGIRFWRSASAPYVGLTAQLEGGYRVASGSDFSLESSPAGRAEDTLPTSRVRLGRVDRSAPYVRLMAGVAF